MFYLNTMEPFLFVEQVDQLEVCLPHSRLLAGIPILAVFQNWRWNSNKTSLALWGKLFLLSCCIYYWRPIWLKYIKSLTFYSSCRDSKCLMKLNQIFNNLHQMWNVYEFEMKSKDTGCPKSCLVKGDERYNYCCDFLSEIVTITSMKWWGTVCSEYGVEFASLWLCYVTQWQFSIHPTKWLTNKICWT